MLSELESLRVTTSALGHTAPPPKPPPKKSIGDIFKKNPLDHSPSLLSSQSSAIASSDLLATPNTSTLTTQTPPTAGVVRHVTFDDSPEDTTASLLVPVIALIDPPSPEVQTSEDVVAGYVK